MQRVRTIHPAINTAGRRTALPRPQNSPGIATGVAGLCMTTDGAVDPAGVRPNHNQQVMRLRRRIRHARIDSVMALIEAVKAKDPHTGRHSIGVAVYAEELARAVGLSAGDLEAVVIAALMHDVGKIAVPDMILTKAGPLTPQEFDVIKQHPAMGVTILRPLGFLERELPLVLHHHEWFNGLGYPHGLQGRQIPLGARLLQVADSIDAMLSPRSYKKARSVEETIAELHRCRGTQFDPDLADLAIAWLTARMSATRSAKQAPAGWPANLRTTQGLQPAQA